MSAPVPGVLQDGSGFQFGTQEFAVEGRADLNPVRAEFRVVSPSYFETLRIPRIAGDACRAQADGVNGDFMVNAAFAARFFFGARAVGARLTGGGFTVAVAGVVGDAREFSLAREPVPTVYDAPRLRDAGSCVSGAHDGRPGSDHAAGARKNQGARAAARGPRCRAAGRAHRQRVHARSPAHRRARAIRGHARWPWPASASTAR